ncbi:cell division protein FtsB [soil metagenome]
MVRIGLLVLLALIQWPLWFGDGGWFKAWERERQLAAQRQAVDQLRLRNASLEAEVRDLRDGTAAIEERARSELGMIKPNEVFVQVLPPGSPKPVDDKGAGHQPPKPIEPPQRP